MQQMIHSQEAKAFLSHDHNVTNTRRPLLPVFLAKGANLISSAKDPGLQKGVATQVMLHVESGHTKILKMLRPYMFTPIQDVIAGYESVCALAPGANYSRHLMPAVELLVDFDLLVCLVTKHPESVRNAPGVLEEASRLVVKAYSRIHNTERLINSGRLPVKHD